MTILFIDSFDHYATEHIPDKGYSEILGGNVVVSAGGGRRGTNSMKSTGFNTGDVLKRNFLASDTIVIGWAWRQNVFPLSDKIVMRINDVGGSSLASVEVTSVGEFKLISGGQTLTTATNFVSPTNYNHFELKYTKGTGSDGFAELRKDGVVILTITTSTATAQAGASTMLERAHLAQNSEMDDFYILNGLGSSPKNDYLGNVRVDCHFADADGADTDFAPNTGAASFQHVDDNPAPDKDDTYVQAGTITNRDLHSMDAAILGTTVYAVQPVVYAKKTDAGTVDVSQISQKPAGAGEKITGDRFASDNYDFHHDILETDPDDVTEWDDTKINATEFGYKIKDIIT